MMRSLSYSAAMAVAAIALGTSAPGAAGKPRRPAPVAPTGLTAAVKASTSVSLTWNPSTSSGIVGYGSYRNGSLLTTAPLLSATVPDLTCGTSYSFTVDALNSYGTRSAQSTALSVTTAPCPVTPAPADTTAPSTPTGLTATGGDGTVSLSWSAATDDTGVTGYQVLRRNADGTWPNTPTATVSVLTYSDTGLTNGTNVTYAVKAIDAAGNVSGASSAASATPATAPIATPVSAFPGTCGKGNWPSADWTPFAKGTQHPWSRPIPANPPLLTSSAGYTSSQMVNWLVNRGPMDKVTVNTGGTWDYSHPYYCATSSDPVFTTSAVTYTGAADGLPVRIPAVAQPRSAAAAGGDGHITIIQPDGTLFDAWQYRGVSGTSAVASAWGKETSVDSGDGSDNMGTTAAWFSNLAGQVRLQELQAGKIQHALFLITNCTYGSAVYPAKSGTTAVACSSDQPALPLGSRVQLDPEYALPAGLPAWKYTILRALQTYGGIIGDTGAYSRSIAMGLQVESGQMYQSSGEGDLLGNHIDGLRSQGDIVKGTNGTTPYYLMDWGRGVDWSRLRVVSPCVSDGTC